VAEPWQEVDDALYKKFEFANFLEAFAFMTKVAQLAGEHDHHPDWSNSWNIVEINLCSHDKGRTVTDRDHRLAESINAMLKEGTK
jgi:4a-hydroxytetrahydrobiopterin dehydratase